MVGTQQYHTFIFISDCIVKTKMYSFSDETEIQGADLSDRGNYWEYHM